MQLRFTILSSLLLAATAPIAIFAQTPAQAPGVAAPKTPRVCPVNRAQPTDGDLALAREDYDAALTFYRAALGKDPTSPEAHLGLVRALIGKDQTTDAIQEAQTGLAKYPTSAIAEVAAGEAAYRNADFESTHRHTQAAMLDDPCEGRALALLAQLSSINALFATENRLLSTAHQLRPVDELIRRDWLQSLPRNQRSIELGNYLYDHPSLSAKNLNDYTNEAQYLKARRPGECHITSNPGTTRIPFQPITGDYQRPEAYGLDVLLNGKRRRMQIDSGASGILLTAAAARRLGLTPEYQLHTGGVGDDGEVKSYLTHVTSIHIGDVEIADCLVRVLQKSNLDSDGLIGVDVFDRFLVTLDYQNAELRLNPLPPRVAAQSATGQTTKDLATAAQQDDDDNRPPRDAIMPQQMQDWLHIARIGHELLLPSHVNGGPLHYMIADTGAGKTVLSPAFAREAGKLITESEIQFAGISGKVKKVYRIDNAVLQFGQLRLPPSSIASFDITSISHDTGVEISGFVGLPTLSRLTITIDYRDNLIQLNYDPKHDNQRF
jgi:predicted aspartyl protease